MNIYKFLVHRQLTAYSGSDKYINVNSINEFHILYDSIINGTITTVNGEVAEALPARDMVKFEITDNLLNKNFPMHIKKSGDGLRFTLTDYVNKTNMIPGQALILLIEITENTCDLYVKTEHYYKYVLERHSSSNLYRILIENPPTDRCGTTQYTDSYLNQFGIVNTHDNSLNWRGNEQYNSYRADSFNQKHIGVPFSSIDNLQCDSFENIEDII